MPAMIYNVIIPKGADWEDAIYATNANTGAMLDLTGFSAKMQARESFDGPALFTLTEVASAAGQITLGGTDGLVRWRLRASVTVTLPAPANLVYDLLLLAPDGSVLRPVQGEASVSPAATVQ